MKVYPNREVQIVTLIAIEAPITISAEHSDFVDLFLKKSAAVLLEHTKINIHAINLEVGKQLPYKPIYSVGPVELEILKTYIKINLANGIIYSSKSPTGATFLFDKKPNRNFRLFVNYRSLNNISIKNRYLLSVMVKFFNHLGNAKQVIQLDLTSAYYRIRIKKGDK